MNASYVVERRLAELITLVQLKALSLTALETATPTRALAGTASSAAALALPMIFARMSRVADGARLATAECCEYEYGA